MKDAFESRQRSRCKREKKIEATNRPGDADEQKLSSGRVPARHVPAANQGIWRLKVRNEPTALRARSPTSSKADALYHHPGRVTRPEQAKKELVEAELSPSSPVSINSPRSTRKTAGCSFSSNLIQESQHPACMKRWDQVRVPARPSSRPTGRTVWQSASRSPAAIYLRPRRATMVASGPT